MKAKRFGRTRAVGHGSVIALLTAALVFFGLTRVVNRPDTRLGKVILTATQNFTITSTISSSNLTETAAQLAPGPQRYLWYTVHNPLLRPITVSALSIQSVTAPAGCAASNLNVSGTTFSGSLVVPASGTNTVVKPISFNDTASNQDTCKSKTFNFTYAGTATYTEVYGTSTVVTSSGSPSIVGAAVTYTATVTGIVGSGQDALPNSPTGTVTFKDGATTICSANIAVASATGTTSTATCTPPAYVTTGTHPITAVYSNSDGNFTGSTSSMFNEVVGFPASCPGTFNIIIGNPASPTVNGTNGNDYIYAAGANFTINGGQGSDCVQAGDGTNTITVGNGSNVIVAGNGKNTISAGNGNNSITVGTGANNTISAGNGNNTFRITSPGNHNTITAGNGTNVAYLGGAFNKLTGGKAGNTCHVPSLPASSVNDTLVNCTAVTP